MGPKNSEMPRFDKELTIIERDAIAGYLVRLADRDRRRRREARAAVARLQAGSGRVVQVGAAGAAGAVRREEQLEAIAGDRGVEVAGIRDADRDDDWVANGLPIAGRVAW